MKTIPTTRSLVLISMSPLLKNIRNWWLKCAERHYLICADVEADRVKEHQRNVAYYQKKAAIARSSRI